MTFLFSDIEGSTELSRRHGAAYGDLRAEHRRVLREVFQAHDGREVDAEGDAFFIGFERASDAVAAAVAAQRALLATGVVGCVSACIRPSPISMLAEKFGNRVRPRCSHP
ncbi:MAG: adenylate/guanylate cyclase domain-containing protein, partial [Gaiella sp.]|uniref:adenylate/guanylate cyclase domain-containing protein n=1 Tax=Gaiella sp. TaxID=2663207 RepID=UPI003C760D52